MPNVAEPALLLVGVQVEEASKQFEYENEKRTDKVRAFRVLVNGSKGGMSYVSIPVDQLNDVRLGFGLPVAWWVRYTPYSASSGAALAVRFISAAVAENDAQLVHETEQKMHGSAQPAGARA